MQPRSNTLKAITLAALFTSPLWSDEAVINYEDHIKPIFREHCVSCHSESDKSSGLSLDSYAAALEGGSGGVSLVASDSGASRMWRLVNHDEQPTMPPDQDKIDAKQLELFKTWIDQGMPENSGSQIKRKKVQIAAATMGANGRPEGAPPMPGDLLLETPRHTAKAAAIAAIGAAPWSPFVAIGGQQQVTLYHLESGELLGVVPFPEGEPQSITFSRDGRLMLVGGGQHSKFGVAALFDITTGKRLTTIGDEIDIVMAADISDDNSKIALAGPQRIVRVFDVASGEKLHELKKHTDWIYALRFSPDGLLLASADRSNALVVWETDTGRMYLDLIGHKNEIRSIDWRPDSLVLYSGSMDNSIKMWDMNNGGLIKSWDAHGGGVTAIDVANDGMIASTGRDNTVKIWDGGGNAAGQMPNLAESGMEVALSVDSQYVIAGDWLGNVRRWKRDRVEDEKQLFANPPTLQMQIAKAKANVEARTGELAAIQSEFNARVASVTDVQTSADKLKAELVSIEQQMSAAQQSISATEPKIATVQQQLAQHVQAIEAKYNEHLELSDKHAVFKAQQQLLQGQLAAVQIAPSNQSDIADDSAEQERSAKAAELTTQISQVAAGLDSASMQVVEKQKEIDQLESVTESLRGSLLAERNSLAVHKSAMELYAKQRVELDLELKALSETLSAAVAERDAAAQKLAGQQALLNNSQSFLTKLENQLSRIDAERVQLAQHASTLEAQLSEMKTSQVALEMTRSQNQSALDEKSNQLIDLQKQIDALLANKATMEAERNSIQQSLSEVQAQMAAHQDKMSEVMGELKSNAEEKARFDAAYPVDK